MKSKYFLSVLLMTSSLLALLFLASACRPENNAKISEPPRQPRVRDWYADMGKDLFPAEIVVVLAEHGQDSHAGIVLNGYRHGTVVIPRESPLRELIVQSGRFTVFYPGPTLENEMREYLSGKTARLELPGLDNGEETGRIIHEHATSIMDCRVESVHETPGATIFRGERPAAREGKAEKRLFLSTFRPASPAIEFTAVPARGHYPEALILLVSGDNNEDNIMTVGTHVFLPGDPSFFAAWVGKTRHSYGLVRESGSFAVVIPGPDMTEEVIVSGTTSGRDKNKFTLLEPALARGAETSLPLLLEAPANYECRVKSEIDWGTHTVFIGQVISRLEKPAGPHGRLFYFGGAWNEETSYGVLP